MRDGTRRRWRAGWPTAPTASTEWETDLSSQTGASQAGILLGSNDDIPAFRWVEKETGRHDLLGAGRLRRDRAPPQQRAGPAARRRREPRQPALGRGRPRILTVSRMEAEKKANPGYRPFLANGYNVTRALVLFLFEVVLEWSAAIGAARRDVQPRGHRGGSYPFMRGGMAVVVRDLAVHSVLTDMMAGRPAVYATFAGYDEVAHHSGLERADTLEVLRKIDQQFGRIVRARRYAPRPYEIVVLSDHGQTQGATFKQRNGYGLDDLVRRSLHRRRGRRPLLAGDENDSAVKRAFQEATGRKRGARARQERRQRRGRRGARLRQPRAHLPHGGAAAPDAGGDRRASPGAASRRCARTRTSAGCSCAPPSMAPSRSARAARATCATGRVEGEDPLAPLLADRRRATCCAPTASRTSPTSSSTASTTSSSTRAAPSRS